MPHLREGYYLLCEGLLDDRAEKEKYQEKIKQSQMQAASFPPRSTVDIDVRYRPSIQVSAKKSINEPFFFLLQIAIQRQFDICIQAVRKSSYRHSDQCKHHDYTLFSKFPRFALPSPVVFLLLFFLSMRFFAQLEFPRERMKKKKKKRSKSPTHQIC